MADKTEGIRYNDILDYLKEKYPNISIHIPVPRRWKVWGNGFKPYLVVAESEPASVDKVG